MVLSEYDNVKEFYLKICTNTSNILLFFQKWDSFIQESIKSIVNKKPTFTLHAFKAICYIMEIILSTKERQ